MVSFCVDSSLLPRSMKTPQAWPAQAGWEFFTPEPEVQKIQEAQLRILIWINITIYYHIIVLIKIKTSQSPSDFISNLRMTLDTWFWMRCKKQLPKNYSWTWRQQLQMLGRLQLSVKQQLLGLEAHPVELLGNFAALFIPDIPDTVLSCIIYIGIPHWS